ncbi:MAG TPA: intersectin-EH binding protein Ibp1, partial [Mycobacterium sp.]|nr:intersectin-EH binding protein Ibp1 [Mycobacterium sp.]
PDIPAIDGIPCAGHNSGQCIGLAEEQQAQGPQPVPRSTVSSSP